MQTCRGAPACCKISFIPALDRWGNQRQVIVQTHPLASQLAEGSWGCTAVFWTVLTYSSDTDHRNFITWTFRHNCLNYLCGLPQILSDMWSKVAVPTFFMWETLLKLQSPLWTRPAGQQGRDPSDSMVENTVKSGISSRNRDFLLWYPVYLITSKEQGSPELHRYFQRKGHSAFLPSSVLRRNIPLPLIFAVFSQHRLRGPCNINLVLPPFTWGCSKGGRSLPFWLLSLTQDS